MVFQFIDEYCNIPICIWLLHRHPYQAPICYVRAATDTQIRVAKHVDPNGRIYLPYLYEWKSSSSNLVGLIQEMEIVFQEQPPVQSKSRSQIQHLEYRKQCIQTALVQQQLAGGDSSNIPIVNTPLRNGYHHRRITAVAGSYSTYLPVGSTNNMMAAPLPPYPTTARHFTNYPLPMQVNVGINGPVNGLPPTLSTIRETEVTATFEAKIKEKLADIFKQIQLPAEMHLLSIDDKDMNSRCPKNKEIKMEELIQKLEQELVEVEKNIILLREVKGSMSELLNKIQSGDSFYVDESCFLSTPLYVQLLNSFAEEKAKEDAFCYLGEAFRRGVIDMDLFLKHVRELSRKDMVLSFLLQNSQEKANATK